MRTIWGTSSSVDYYSEKKPLLLHQIAHRMLNY